MYTIETEGKIIAKNITQEELNKILEKGVKGHYLRIVYEKDRPNNNKNK